MTSINICIIEDEPDVLDTLKSFFELKGHGVVGYESVESFEISKQNNFSGLYLIDWSLPGKSGLELIKDIRGGDDISPIFIVSGYGQKEQIVEGLNSGADDYITKPFNFDELHARVANAAKKFNRYVMKKANSQSTVGVRLLPEANSFIKDEVVIGLTHREFIIFATLSKNTDSPISREELLNEFSCDESMTIRNIDVHIFSLRKKIKDANLIIKTIRGVGYQLVFPT